jgi:hypothetical protein
MKPRMRHLLLAAVGFASCVATNAFALAALGDTLASQERYRRR